MAKIHLMGAAVVVASIVAAGCCDKENCKENCKENEVLLTVNGKTLKRGELDADVAKIIAFQGSDRIPAEKVEEAKVSIARQIAQQFMIETVLGGKAAQLGYTTEEADLKEREAKLLKAAANEPDAPKSIDDLLAKHPFGKDRALKELKTGIAIDKMIKGEVYAKDTTDYSEKAKEIIDNVIAMNEKCHDDATALAKITEFKKTLDATAAADVAAKFAELAKAESGCPSGQNGGDLREFTHGQMVPEFDKVAFELPVGKVSEPVKTQYGYHLILVTAKTPAVEATDDKPGEPEKVRASHILLKVCEKQPVPEMENVVEFLKSNSNRSKVTQFIIESAQKAQITAADEFKMLLPPPVVPEAPAVEVKAAEKAEEPAEAKPEEKPVENPAEK